jgi:hypothetical protein
VIHCKWLKLGLAIRPLTNGNGNDLRCRCSNFVDWAASRWSRFLIHPRCSRTHIRTGCVSDFSRSAPCFHRHLPLSKCAGWIHSRKATSHPRHACSQSCTSTNYISLRLSSCIDHKLHKLPVQHWFHLPLAPPAFALQQALNSSKLLLATAKYRMLPQQ